MKKIILIAAIAFSTTAFADQIYPRPYFKLQVSGNKMDEMTEKNGFMGVHVESNKSKSKISPTFTVGFGLYTHENWRLDVTLGYSNISFKDDRVEETLFYNDPAYVAQSLLPIQSIVARKSSIYDLMLNVYTDIPVHENMKLYIGGGIGFARIEEELTQRWIYTQWNSGRIVDSGTQSKTYKSKSRFNFHNFAYSLTAGSSIRVTSNAHLELAYSWKDFEKTFHGDGTTNNTYKGHMVSAGIRFDI